MHKDLFIRIFVSALFMTVEKLRLFVEIIRVYTLHAIILPRKITVEEDNRRNVYD